MNNKRRNCFIRFINTSCIFILILIGSIATAKAKEATGISIKTDRPMVGSPIKVKVTGESKDCTYQWYRDEELTDCTDSQYIPEVSDYETWLKVALVDGEGNILGTDQVYFSKLPVVYIDTEDGEEITEKTTYKSAHMYIQGSEKYNTQYDEAIEIKGRGNTSWGWPKKPYKIKLNESTSLFGFGKNKHYVLLANYLDESLLRNTVGTALASELGLVSMETTWVDVVLNGKYIGNYQLCEHIRIGEERIDIHSWADVAENVAKEIYKENKANGFTKDQRDELEELLKEDLSWVTTGQVFYNNSKYNIKSYYDKNITGGYLFELSEEYDEISQFTTNNGVRIMMNSPEYLKTNTKMMNYVKNYWQEYENAYLSQNGYNEKDKHYTEYADIDSMVAYWLAMEVLGNDDAVWKSRYAYKDTDDVLKFGPVWDFDWGCGSYPRGTEATGWRVAYPRSSSFFVEWLRHPEFVVKAYETYWNIHDYLEEMIADDGIIDSYIEYIKESGEKNEDLWWYNRGFTGETGDVALYKTYLKERFAWLDTVFASEEILIASLPGSTHYIKSDEQISLQFNNALRDDLTASRPADGKIVCGKELSGTVIVKDEDTISVSVYANGIKAVEDLSCIEGTCTFGIEPKYLTESFGKKNVISVIGKNKDGEVTYKNYATVIVYEEAREFGMPYQLKDGEKVYNVENPHVIINQIYCGENSSHDFIEIYNPTEEDVDLSSWSLQYRPFAEEEEVVWQKLNLDGTIKAHSSYLIRGMSNENGTGQIIQIDKKDQEWTTLNMNGGSVVLLANQNRIMADELVYDNEKGIPLTEDYVDMVAFSHKEEETGFYSEKTPSVVQYTKEALRRIDFTDTDNNSLEGDFESVSYDLANEEYIQWILPRSSQDGKWMQKSSDKPQYSVTYETNGGSSMDSVYYLYNQTISIPSDPIKEGYIFTGWYREPELLHLYDFSERPVSNMILYAGWEKVPVPPKELNPSGGTGGETHGEVTGNSKLKISLIAKYKKSGKKKQIVIKNVKKVTLHKKGRKQIQFIVKINGKKQKMKWTVSNSKIIKVSASGKVTAKKAGKACVIAKKKDVTIRCRIIVKKGKK